MHVYRGTNKTIHIFQPQKSITIYLVSICCNFFYICLFFQVENLNLATNLENYCFYAMLIASKCTPLYKKLDCNAKSEPPYLATTQYQMNLMYD
jgi:tryptophan-rich sensory protein